MSPTTLSQSFRIENYQRIDRSTLKASFSIILPSQMRIHECRLFENERGRWINLPAHSYEGKDGKKAYTDFIDFADKAAKRRFQTLALAAIDAFSATIPDADAEAVQNDDDFLITDEDIPQ